MNKGNVSRLRIICHPSLSVESDTRRILFSFVKWLVTSCQKQCSWPQQAANTAFYVVPQYALYYVLPARQRSTTIIVFLH